MEEVNVINKKTNSGYKSSIVFLAIVIITTVGLSIYNNFLVSEIKKIQKSITSIESNITEVEKDKNLQIYSLLELNKWVIDSYKVMNNVTKYINHMDVIEDKYQLKFSWFKLSEWKISTSIKTMSDDNWIAYMKTKDFIKNYRNDPNSLFDLDFIKSFEWMDIMKFNVDFKIK